MIRPRRDDATPDGSRHRVFTRFQGNETAALRRSPAFRRTEEFPMNMQHLTETQHARLATAILTNPLTQTGKPGHLMRLCLAMAISYGMPPQVAATLDDLAAMFGFYEPLPSNAQQHLTAPLVTWRTDQKQPLMDIVDDVAELALHQRALIAFGGHTPGHMVGTAEIVFAMGNTHPDAVPDNDWVELFQWAATDVLSVIKQIPPDDVRNLQTWPLIEDQDVIEPGGRLHEIYNLVVTTIRREAIAALKGEPERDLRRHHSARQLAANFRALYHGLLKRAGEDTEEAEGLRHVIANIERIYPQLDEEMALAEAGVESLLDDAPAGTDTAA
jgi:hypothetical protein